MPVNIEPSPINLLAVTVPEIAASPITSNRGPLKNEVSPRNCSISSFPCILVFPTTSNLACGSAVPIPTFTESAPVPPITAQFEQSTLALKPIAIARSTGSLFVPAATPKKVFLVPVVLEAPASRPIKVLAAPVVLLLPASLPKKVFSNPFVFESPASLPKKVL